VEPVSLPDGLPGPDWRVWLGLGITTVWLALGAWYVTAHLGWSAFLAQPADVLGSFLEGAFAPLAFLWLVIGYFLQQKELTQNTAALRGQLREVQRTAEQAVIQSQKIAASEFHARQGTFLQLAERVHAQMGSIAGLLFISSQGAGAGGAVDGDELSRLWSEQKRGDPEVFARRLLELAIAMEEPDEAHALFYGTEVRARHSNHLIHVFERLLARAGEADGDDGRQPRSLVEPCLRALVRVACKARSRRRRKPYVKRSQRGRRAAPELPEGAPGARAGRVARRSCSVSYITLRAPCQRARRER
jgi:hypothetical protein